MAFIYERVFGCDKPTIRCPLFYNNIKFLVIFENFVLIVILKTSYEIGLRPFLHSYNEINYYLLKKKKNHLMLISFNFQILIKDCLFFIVDPSLSSILVFLCILL